MEQDPSEIRGQGPSPFQKSLGVGSVLSLILILYTNAGYQTSSKDLMEQMLAPMTDHLQTQCQCEISLSFDANAEGASRFARRGIQQAIRSLSHLCREDRQKVCSSVQTVRFQGPSQNAGTKAKPSDYFVQPALDAGTLTIALQPIETGASEGPQGFKDSGIFLNTLARQMGIQPKESLNQ